MLSSLARALPRAARHADVFGFFVVRSSPQPPIGDIAWWLVLPARPRCGCAGCVRRDLRHAGVSVRRFPVAAQAAGSLSCCQVAILGNRFSRQDDRGVSGGRTEVGRGRDSARSLAARVAVLRGTLRGFGLLTAGCVVALVRTAAASATTRRRPRQRRAPSADPRPAPGKLPSSAGGWHPHRQALRNPRRQLRILLRFPAQRSRPGSDGQASPARLRLTQVDRGAGRRNLAELLVLFFFAGNSRKSET